MPTTTKPTPGLRRVAANPAAVLADPAVRRNVRACLKAHIPPADIAKEVGCCAADLHEQVAHATNERA